ncbi:rhamnogalacturonan lyase B N-terminal domain-containing protein [Sphingomonas sp. ASY06-1R]|uniref:rhamnogalacturonan lyase B N-terminal domain-containing protein n=1 Tax=Sphingomonas sp. ASY06-1R TaxID=3445771 RepID=UPI003FA20CD0
MRRIALGVMMLCVTGGLGTPGPAKGATAPDASFGLRQDAQAITVDTGAGLVFRISRRGEEGHARRPGDIISMVYDGVDYQDPNKGSQINSGFADLYDGQPPVDVSAVQPDADHIKVTVRAGDLIHYYLARRGTAAIFMGTYFTREPKPNLVRFVARIPHRLLPDGPPAADVSQAVRTVEAHDVFGLADGQTRSKHYSNMRLKDWQLFGARGRRVGLWMARDDNEGGSGGPFYRSLRDQGAAVDQELTYIVNYNEVQTEPYRTGILNAYALLFTHGETPAPPDMDWLARMGLAGYVPPDRRGAIAGAGLIGTNPAFRYTIGFANAAAQYWTDASPAGGRFQRGGIRPGTYAMTVYKGELAVATRDVTIDAGRTSALGPVRIENDPERAPAVWRTGHWDGTPAEFRNGGKMTMMHPSDVRMASWKAAPFLVGSSIVARDFPACQWADVNSPLVIRFTMSPQQVRASLLRIGVTIAFANARPTIEVNGWTGPVPPPSVQPATRSLTVGSYRGNNRMFTFAIPASALKAGANELRLSIASGKGGKGFLSAGVAYDAIDLLPADPPRQT